jgi:AraC-like DNA-binding protein
LAGLAGDGGTRIRKNYQAIRARICYHLELTESMKTDTLQDYKRRMLRVLVHIQQHLDEPLSLEERARLACFSPFHFHRVFKGMVGETPNYARTTHFSPYHQLGETYSSFLGQWLPRSGRELRTAPCFEVYLNDPQSTDPEDLLTDIYAPLK